MKKVYSATVTPLTKDNKLDVSGLERIFARNIRHGLDGVFILGSMGEWGSFDMEDRENIIRESVRAADGKLEILAGIHCTGLDLTLRMMERAAKYNVNSYVLTLPAKTSAINPLEYVLAVLDRADRPVYYYHCPPNNGIALIPSDFETLLRHPRLKGIKNSAGDMGLRKELILLKQNHDFSLLEGHEWAIDEALLVGCDGVLCGLGALASKPMVEIAKAVDRGDVETAVTTQRRLIEIFHAIYGVSKTTVWTGQKYALKQLGLIASDNALVQSTHVLTDARKSEINNCLKTYKLFLD